MIATQSEEKLGITIPKPLVFHFTKEESMNAPGDLRTLIVQIPSPFSYKDNKAVPWNYNVEVHLAKQKNKDVSSSKTTAVTNVSGIGRMTRNDRICSPGKSQREMRVVFEKAYTDKEEKKVENEKVENEVSNEEAQEFLKIIKQSEYKIVDQLNHTPTRISLLSLLMNSESHWKLLMKILNEAHVTHDITVDKFRGIINNITTNNHLTFTDDELLTEGRGHNKALHISVMYLDHIMSRVLIDNGSSLNVISKSTLAKLPCDGTYMRPSPKVVRAFDGSRREIMGEIDLPVQIGPVTFEITFHVMDIVPAYSCLLGRPWIHSVGVVPSTLHQKLKYMINDQLVIVSGEGDLLVSNLSTTPYVETTEDALETTFQTLEIVDTAYVETIPIEPHMSNTAIMVAKFMLSRGHHPWHGLGKDEEGLKESVELPENRDKWGLGYKPTRDDKRRLVKEKKEKRLARIENREPRIERIPICDIRQSFQSARPTSEIHIAAAEDDMFDGEANWIRPCGVGVEIRNWKVVKSHMIFNAIPIFGNSSFTDDCTKISLHNLNHLVSQTEKDNEEDYEPPLDLLKAVEREAQGIMPFEEPIEIVNRGTEGRRKEIKDMPGLDTSIVEHKLPLKPDSSPCQKKDGKVQMCVDYRDLNKASPKDDFPLPHIDILVGNTARHSLFSFMDGFSGYNQIKMAAEDMEKTTFITPWGTFCYKVMPFGLKNAGATYQRAMVTLFHDMIHKEVEVYVDDMIAKSQTEEEHIIDLKKLFKRLRKFKLKLNPSKCTFGVRSGKVLGFVFSQRGIEVDPDKIRAIAEMPPPSTEKEVRGFLGRLSLGIIKLRWQLKIWKKRLSPLLGERFVTK
ncbi:uncharacterized protein [Cicer arietinum]|uniref:Uncharacterized protein LOC105851591 n=1 Tax=Cicer arietinum TaxID=3827 RepID=A0A3Q7YCZ3_CICAR|nr:uncharacterized protein LOC105851591 [Cicer arietinum]